MAPIYSKKGDTGQTSLLGGVTVSKDDLQVEAYGTVDELNSAIGLAISNIDDSEVKEQLRKIQKELFGIGTTLASGNLQYPAQKLGLSTQQLEEWIDHFEQALPKLRNFILPGGSQGASAIHLARAICRRAERQIVALIKRKGIQEQDMLLAYINRLSDYLFVVARAVNWRRGISDVGVQD